MGQRLQHRTFFSRDRPTMAGILYLLLGQLNAAGCELIAT
jgi:hypothetical protein